MPSHAQHKGQHHNENSDKGWQKVSYLWRYTLHTSLRGSADSISMAKPIEKIIIVIIMNFTLVI